MILPYQSNNKLGNTFSYKSNIRHSKEEIYNTHEKRWLKGKVNVHAYT